ncbi:MAG TPA: hypothetical protein VFU14_06900 [Acidimicrobiales bacterium]|nr:hypothetical protein [Acidimicrobiales bacterium]
MPETGRTAARPPRGGRARSAVVALVLLVLASAFVVPGGPAGAAPTQPEEPGKVLVVSAPALRWSDLVDHDLPNIEGWMADASVAMLSLRTLGARTGIGEGYLTMGAGNRAGVSSSIEGMALAPGERFEEGTASQAFERRTGTEATGELLQLGFPAIARANDRYLYGAEPGALATTLEEHGLVMGVVANADTGIGLAPDPAAEEAPADDAPVGEDVDAGVEEELPAEEPAAEEEPEVDEVVEDEEPAAEDPDVPTPEPLELTTGQYARAAALAAIDETGQVARAESRGLLRRDVDAPYGVRYHPPAVLEAFEAMWSEVDVALVELSDLDRADQFRRDAASEPAAAMWEQALVHSDEVFGALLDAVEPGTTVILATPAPPRAAETLGVFAMSDAGGEGRLARSGTTRRPGYVTLPDIAPTVVRHFDLDQPSSMTGTVIRPGERVTVDDARFEAFAGTTAEAKFRDRATGPVSVVFVIVQILAYALAAVAVARRRRWTRPVSYLALVVLATPPVGFLAGVLHVESADVTAYTLAIFAAAVVVAALAEGIGALVARRWPRTRATLPPLLLVSLSWLVLVVDVVTGGRLQINTVFGYSPLVAGRFAGFGNLAFALVGVGAVVVACGGWGTARLAAGPADGSSRLRGLAAAAVIAFLVLTVVIDGAPPWGSDVGGVLATVPGFAVLVLVAMGVRVDVKRAVAIGVATIVAIGVFAAIDLSRPEEDRTHLGRLVDRVLDDDGGGGFLDVIQRKLTTNLNILTSSIWTLTIPFALGLLIYLARRRTGFLRDLQEGVPGIRPMLAGGLLVAVLGFALNDSGVAVPAMMFAILLPYLTYVLLRWDPARR